MVQAPLKPTREQVDEADERLVAAVRAGDDRAFGVLYGRYRVRIGAFARGILSDRHRAEDVAQEVFIAALRRLRATDRPIAFKPWLFEITRNACIDELRRRGRVHEVPLEGSTAESRLDGPSPQDVAEARQRLADLLGALRALPESQHRILVLRELEGLTYSQIEDRLGVSKPVVESTLFRARRRLGEELAEIESGRRCQRVRDIVAGVQTGRLITLGVRDRQMLARHLVDCGSCRRHAHHETSHGLDARPSLEMDPPATTGRSRWLRIASLTPVAPAASAA